MHFFKTCIANIERCWKFPGDIAFAYRLRHRYSISAPRRVQPKNLGKEQLPVGDRVFQEVIYQRALAIEFELEKIDFQREMDMGIYYRDRVIGTRRVDFFVANKIMVELEAIIKLEDVHLAQAINYLEAYKMEIGLLLNFGEKSSSSVSIIIVWISKIRGANISFLHHVNPLIPGIKVQTF